jgi:RHS repeat-associated protein
MTVFFDVVATSPAAAYADGSNLVTITRVIKTGNFPGRTASIVRPDGTGPLYSYFYNNPSTGQTKTTVTNDGTTTVTVTNAQGQPVSEIVTDAASGIQLSNTGYADFDSFGRWRTATYNDGTLAYRTYNCCGLESETDRSGMRTVYGQDSLKRVNRQTLYAGAAATPQSDTEFTFDAASRALKTIRHSAGSSLDASVPATITATDATYNLAGQLTAITTPRSSTTIDETITVDGKRQVTTTYADLGTRIELYNRSGQLASVSGTAASPMKYVYGVDTTGEYTQQIKLGDAGAETEWTKEYRDFAGRPADTVFADGAKIVRTYFAASDAAAGRRGKLASETRPPDSDIVGALGVRTLFDYNSRGEQEVVALDLNQNGVIDYAGSDRITKTVTDVATVVHDSVSYPVRRSTTSVWATANTDTASSVTVNENSTDGLHSWQTAYGLPPTSSAVGYSGNGARNITTTAPDGTIATQNYVGERLTDSTVKTPALSILTSTVVVYDGYGRTERVTDARNGATTFTYYNDGLQKTVLSPDPDTSKSGPGYDPQLTQYFYDPMGRLTRTILPDAAETYTRFWPTGLLKRNWGARTTPQEMTYDLQGRLKTSATWTNFIDETSFASSVGKAVTTWNYSPTRGWLDTKRYADSRGPGYLYFPSGAIKQRTWARTVGGAALTTTYAFNTAGELSSVDYSDTTPDVSGIVYDRLGRRTGAVDAAGTLTTTYEGLTPFADDESYAAGTGALAGLAVNRTRDILLRPHSLDVPSVSSVVNDYHADTGRLETITAGSLTHTYTYQPQSALIDTLTQKRSGATVLTTTKQFDKLNRLSGISSVSSVPSVVNSAAYAFNAANQRTRLTEADGKFWDFGYDALGQVTAGTNKLADSTPVLGHSFGYSFDTIGNLKTTAVNGQSATYTPDTAGLNQYASRTVPAALDIIGTADAGAKVAVNLAPAQRQGDLFYKQLPVTNASAAKWQLIDVLAGKAGAGAGGADADVRQSGHLFLAKTPESFTYDFDGNLTGDGQWTYIWDAENRLTTMETQASAVTAGVPKQKLEFVYDFTGRRIQKKVSNWSGSAYLLGSDTRFLYDGWNLLAEFNALSSNAVVRSYVWGIDLSGTAQGAGGIGGLLAVTTYNQSPLTYLPVFDGNGNVIGLVDAVAGTSVAQYEYGPFGEPLRVSGPAAAANPFRFSTKYTDVETGQLYYGYRYYNPSTKRWLSRDLIEENGGVHIYGFVGNDSIGNIDPFGLEFNDTGYYPHGQNEAAPVIDNAYRCCDDKSRAEGLKTLEARFGRARAEIARRGVSPRGIDDASCKNTSYWILDSFQPIPKCWECSLERRIMYAVRLFDHQVITCRSKGSSGNTIEEKIFDFWGGGTGPQSPTKFRTKYWVPSTPENPYEANRNDTCDITYPVPGDPFRNWDRGFPSTK